MVRLQSNPQSLGRIALIDAEVLDRLELREQSACGDLWRILDEVMDPEIPVLSIWDLGVLRNVERDAGLITVVITPTYSGCPAMQAIEDDVYAALRRHGYQDVRVETRLAPAWTTDWMSEVGRARLRAYGIAPPVGRAEHGDFDVAVACPHCGAADTRRISEFGSTACKALYQCKACLEPFDYFKCI